MKDFVLFALRQIVDEPEAVDVIESVDPQSGFTDLQIIVAPNDIGKVIGKEGKTIRSLRELVRVVATKQHVRFNLSLKDQ